MLFVLCVALLPPAALVFVFCPVSCIVVLWFLSGIVIILLGKREPITLLFFGL